MKKLLLVMIVLFTSFTMAISTTPPEEIFSQNNSVILINSNDFLETETRAWNCEERYIHIRVYSTESNPPRYYVKVLNHNNQEGDIKHAVHYNEYYREDSFFGNFNYYVEVYTEDVHVNLWYYFNIH